MKACLPIRRRVVRTLCLALAALAIGLKPASASEESLVRLQGHIPTAVAGAQRVERLNPKQPISITFVLPLRNKAGLQDLLQRQNNPNDPLYHQYLSPQQFAEQFAPTQQDYEAVAAWARSKGLTVTTTPANRLLLGVKGQASDAEAAFDVHLHRYISQDGAKFYAPDTEPALPASIAGRVQGLVGLDSTIKSHSNVHVRPLANIHALPDPKKINNGHGVGGGYNARDIQIAYNMNTFPQLGDGQTVALYELDGFSPDDIDHYRKSNHLPPANLEVVLVDGADGSAGFGSSEVVLDIDMVSVLAPNARILVYEGGPDANTVLDTYNQIALDDRAQQISTSWYIGYEDSLLNSLDVVAAADQIMQEFAAQGQTIFVASGDYGAYDPFTGAVSVQYPASDPFVCGVGGTELTTFDDRSYKSEHTWNDMAAQGGFLFGGASGGGKSQIFSITSYQLPFALGDTEAAQHRRNVPDVAANASDLTPYSIYVSTDPFAPPGWYLVSGTSAAAPLWAGYIARVNQFRAENGLGQVGFINPTLYDIASNFYLSDFHDIADHLTNGNASIFGAPGYTAIHGFDLTVGLGSFVGFNLFQDLIAETPSYAPPVAPKVTAESGDGYVKLSWTKSLGATKYIIWRFPSANYGVPIAIVKDLKLTDTNVANNNLYTYSIQPVGKGGEGGYGIAEAFPAKVAITGGPSFESPNAIVWATNVLSDSTVNYGVDPTQLTSTASNSAFTTAHVVHLHGLAHNTTYYYQVTSFDGVVTTHSKVHSFTTP